jgi:hypothetical protein
VARDFSFHLCTITSPDDPTCDPILESLKVEILETLTGEVLGEGYTDGGALTLSLSVPQPDTPLSVRVGAASVLLPVTTNSMEIQIPRTGPLPPTPKGGE